MLARFPGAIIEYCYVKSHTIFYTPLQPSPILIPEPPVLLCQVVKCQFALKHFTSYYPYTLIQINLMYWCIYVSYCYVFFMSFHVSVFGFFLGFFMVGYVYDYVSIPCPAGCILHLSFKQPRTDMSFYCWLYYLTLLV